MGASGAWAPNHAPDQAALGLGGADEGGRWRPCAEPKTRDAPTAPSRAAAHATSSSLGTGALAYGWRAISLPLCVCRPNLIVASWSRTPLRVWQPPRQR